MVLHLGLINKPASPFAVTAIDNLCAHADIKVPSDSRILVDVGYMFQYFFYTCMSQS